MNKVKLPIVKKRYYFTVNGDVVMVLNQDSWLSSDGRTWSCACNFTAQGGQKCWSTLGLSKKDFVRFATKYEVNKFKNHQVRISK